MRGTIGKLCHGGPRKPREPNGFVAPLVRAVAWAVLFVAAAGTAIGRIAARVGWRGAEVAGAVAALGVLLAVTIRYVAGFLRPAPLDLAAVELEPPR